MNDAALVYVVDDDEGVRHGLRLLLASGGVQTACFADPLDFLDSCQGNTPGCVLLDVRMPGMSGLDLQQRLHDRGVRLPVIVLTGHADVPMAVRAMKVGAFDFIQKPFNEQQLLDRVFEAIAQDRQRRARDSERAAIAERLQRLTPREREVLDRIVAGQANKVIARELAISERTVELHRAHLLQKMGLRSVAQLVQAVLSTQIPGGEAG